MTEPEINAHLADLCLHHGLRRCGHSLEDGVLYVTIMRAEDGQVAVGSSLPDALAKLGAIATPQQIRERKLAEARAEVARLEKLK